MMFPNLSFQESRTGSTFCKNLAHYMSSASEERKFYDLAINTRSKKIYHLIMMIVQQGWKPIASS